MADTPPTPNPKAAAKGLMGKLKGKPAWFYVAGITVIIGLAFFVRRREALANSTSDGQDPNVVDNTTGAVGDGSLYPSASEGAFGGYSDPTINSTGTPSATDNAGNPEPPTVVVNIPGPVQTDPQFTPADSVPASAITGGGTKPPRVVAQHTQPTTAQDLVAKALARINVIRATSPTMSVTTQVGGTPKALAQQAKDAAKPNIFTQDEGTRAGLNYQLVHKNGKWYRFYESRPGKGDWGAGGKVLRK